MAIDSIDDDWGNYLIHEHWKPDNEFLYMLNLHFRREGRTARDGLN